MIWLDADYRPEAATLVVGTHGIVDRLGRLVIYIRNTLLDC